jgi:hypothetical protein
MCTSFGSLAEISDVSFDHLVRDGEQRRRCRKAKRFGGLEIDDELKFGRPLDRNVRRLRPPQNLVHIVGRASPEKVWEVWSIGDQAARFNDLPSTMYCRQSCSERPGVNAIPVRDYERVVDDVKCIRATIERFEGGRTPANHSTEIYWFARSAAAVAMYFE